MRKVTFERLQETPEGNVWIKGYKGFFKNWERTDSGPVARIEDYNGGEFLVPLSRVEFYDSAFNDFAPKGDNNEDRNNSGQARKREDDSSESSCDDGMAKVSEAIGEN